MRQVRTIHEQFTFYFGAFKHWRTMDARRILHKIAQCEVNSVGDYSAGGRFAEALDEMALAKRVCKEAIAKNKTPYQILNMKRKL